ncbi:MAG: metallophosphoesterase [Lachnospiraceae bacterium]|nr:metallophosphoesterase [Lachnospiraceae bacterium]
MSEDRRQNSTKIAVTADLHLLAQSLHDLGEAFLQMYHNGDGKQTKNGTKLIRQMFSEIRKAHPDAVLIAGDLTLNGERASHEEMVEQLRIVKDDGISVYVLPGNHDIGRIDAKGYFGEEEFSVPTVTEHEFAAIYEDFGYGQAVSRDPNSLSYVVKLSDQNWLFCLDNCCRINGIPQRYGELSEASLIWLEEMLKKAREVEAFPIVAGHYNLAYHNKVFKYGFTMRNHNEVGDLLRKYQTVLYLSGHMHMQHMKFQSGIMDIATSSPATYPHQYGMLQIDHGNKAYYQTQQISMDIHEREHFRKFYQNNFKKQVLGELEHKSNLTQDEKERMAAFAAKMNLFYFSGYFYMMEAELGNSEEWALWIEKANDIFFYTYLKSMIYDSMRNHNIYTDSIKRKQTDKQV